ncbi:pro-neuropeptide Y-like isoform X1 [Schistosoma japonicum]|uniref:Pro-neuropeptide Y-like isoform X1 n=1 Tax=Schistosoma japonicum TaxID=6182 RepID=A0A4Z2D169_SCHJA|nr:pro-neuropeptide Y-like isoform X1 [Schistosoma japonicum]
MNSLKDVWRFRSYYIHLYVLISLVFVVNVYEVNGQIYPYKWKNIHSDMEYLPVNKMTITSLLGSNDHNNNEDKIIKTRSAEIMPPERPPIFETPEALRSFLQRLNEYFAIIGRPRFGRRR